MKHKTLSILITIIILIAFVVVANFIFNKKARHPANDNVSIKINYPSNGTTWSFGSKQKITWSISGLPTGNYNAVVYLENSNDGTKGYIASKPVDNGLGDANYVVNLYEDKNGKDIPLKNGKYKFSLAIYDTADPNQYAYGYGNTGDLVIEKDSGIITIADSDVY